MFHHFPCTLCCSGIQFGFHKQAAFSWMSSVWLLQDIHILASSLHSKLANLSRPLDSVTDPCLQSSCMDVYSLIDYCVVLWEHPSHDCAHFRCSSSVHLLYQSKLSIRWVLHHSLKLGGFHLEMLPRPISSIVQCHTSVAYLKSHHRLSFVFLHVAHHRNPSNFQHLSLRHPLPGSASTPRWEQIHTSTLKSTLHR